MPFRSLGLDDRIFKAIKEAGYTEPTPIQAAAIPEVLAGRDVIGIAQTGTGKTAAFVLPILHHLASRLSDDANRRGTRALVVAPTRELVMQIEENVRAYGKHLPFRMATVVGGLRERPQIEALRSGVELVVATPLPCDLASTIELELDGAPGRFAAGAAVLSGQGADAKEPPGLRRFALGPIAGLPPGAIDRPGERRLRVLLAADPDRGWADPDVRSLWPGTIATEWAPVRVVRR